MADLIRQEIAATSPLLVVKVGTRVLTHPDGTLNEARIASLAEELHDFIEGGRRVVLVSSGSVGAGMNALGLTQRPTDISHLQAVAAVGQARLIETYDRSFRQYGRHAAQVLLVADDLDDRSRYLNARNTLLTLLEYGTIPVINENDTVAVDELMATFGDNDRLAALVTNLLRAPLLVILSDVEGLYDGDPQQPDSKIISTVQNIDEQTLSYVCEHTGGISKGGMASKLEAARIATSAGENVIVASGRKKGVLHRIASGEPEGTLFLAQGRSISPWKRWIGFSAQARGRLSLDRGATQAIGQRGGSLLAAGITAIEGDFTKGDVISLCDAAGHEIARGLTNYTASEIRQIAGCQSDKIAEALGHCPYDEVIHRDNMALTSSNS